MSKIECECGITFETHRCPGVDCQKEHPDNAEAELRETTGELAIQRDMVAVAVRAQNSAMTRLTEATALLERCLHGGLCSAHTRSEVAAWLASRAPVAVAPSQPAHAEGEAKAPSYEYCLGQLCQDLGMLTKDLGSLLSAHGLSIVPTAPAPRVCTPAERAVLDACAAFPTAALRHDAVVNRQELSDLSLRWTDAELARRNNG